MALVLQIVLLLAVLLGLIGAGMSIKNWHWSQMLLLLSVVFAATGFSILAAETVRIHKKLRSPIPRLEQDLARFEKQNQELLRGTEDKRGVLQLEHEVRLVTRQRGRVWRGVAPAGQLQAGQLAVAIPQPKPHGLDENAIVYLFESGEPNAREPASGAQYLGEFRVQSTDADGAVLESVQLLGPRTGERLARSQGPWVIYESMPSDSHDHFTNEAGEALPQEELQALLPAESVAEYIRHNTPATADDDQWVRAGYDENDELVGPEEIDRAVRFRYSRPLRDYAYQFSKLAEDRIVAVAKKAALEEDISKLETALASAKKLTEFRESQKETYADDLAGTRREVEAIESHLALVERQLKAAGERIDRYLNANSELAQRLVTRQLTWARQIDAAAPAPE